MLHIWKCGLNSTRFCSTGIENSPFLNASFVSLVPILLRYQVCHCFVTGLIDWSSVTVSKIYPGFLKFQPLRMHEILSKNAFLVSVGLNTWDTTLVSENIQCLNKMNHWEGQTLECHSLDRTSPIEASGPCLTVRRISLNESAWHRPSEWKRRFPNQRETPVYLEPYLRWSWSEAELA